VNVGAGVVLTVDPGAAAVPGLIEVGEGVEDGTAVGVSIGVSAGAWFSMGVAVGKSAGSIARAAPAVVSRAGAGVLVGVDVLVG
jgi:hypothetical protein